MRFSLLSRGLQNELHQRHWCRTSRWRADGWATHDLMGTTQGSLTKSLVAQALVCRSHSLMQFVVQATDLRRWFAIGGNLRPVPTLKGPAQGRAGHIRSAGTSAVFSGGLQSGRMGRSIFTGEISHGTNGIQSSERNLEFLGSSKVVRVPQPLRPDDS